MNCVTCSKVLDWVAYTLVVIGALNWGFIGLFDIDVVAIIFNDMGLVTRIIYGLVGLAGLRIIYICWCDLVCNKC